MYVISNNSKIFHNNECVHARKIKPHNRVLAYRAKEFTKQGYHMCQFCSKLGKKYRGEKNAIQTFIQDKNMKVWYENNTIYIENGFVAWKITDENNNGKMALYHSNSENYKLLKKEKGKIVHNYHHQTSANSETIIGFLKYIFKHDNWRIQKLDEYKNMPQVTKKQKFKYNLEKKKSERAKIRNVLNLLDMISAEREYKEC